ncbi:MAG: hypothetical protein KAJ15_04420 [Spirochaetes bacterium]|nr:hypothetical protein [Spirochaetota bacterium]
MNKNALILKWSLLAGSIYFILVAAAHMIGIKIPGLFVYYNLPSYAYQDKIIAFFSFGWSVFLFTAFLNPVKNVDLVKAILISGTGAIAGLCLINLFTDFHEMSETINVLSFWIEVLCLSFYLIWLTIFYFRGIKDKTT